MHRYNPITEGLIKAMGFMAQARPPAKPKYTFAAGEPVWHSTERLSPAQRVVVDQILALLETPDITPEQRSKVYSVLHTYGMRLRATKHATRIDYSRYQGDLLGQVKATGGVKEQARAARRAASLQTATL